jgi:hypothetical protein
MGTEWYLQSYDKNGEQFISVKNIMEIFSKYVIEKLDYGVNIKFEDDTVFHNTIFIHINYLEKEISHLTIEKPIEHKELFKVIYKIMQLGNFIFFAPSANYPILLDESIEKHLPDGMIEVIGKPKIAKNEIEFINLFNKLYKQNI